MKSKNKISSRWIRSMVLLVLIILSLCSILLGYDLVILRSVILRSISTMTEYLQSSVDSRLKEIQNYATTLELHNTNDDTKRITRTGEAITREQYSFSELVSNFKLTNRFLEGVLLYYPRADLIIGDLGCFPSYSYYALDNNLDTSGYDSWIAEIQESRTGLKRLHAGETVQFCSIKSMLHRGEVAGYIIFRFNTAELLRSTENIVSRKPSRLAFGIMLEDEILSYSGNGEVLRRLAEGQQFSEGESKTVSKNQFLLHARSSQLPGVHYLNAYYLPDNFQPLILPLVICVIGILGIGLFGIVYAISISRKNSEPLQGIIDKLGDVPAAGLNEYQIINRRIDTLLKEQHSRVSQLQVQQGMIGGLFLNIILNTDIPTESGVFNITKRYDIVFHNPFYLIAVVRLDPREQDSLHGEILRWWEEKGQEVIVSYMNQKYVILFNPEEETPPEALRTAMEALLHQPFWQTLHSAALGRCYDSLVSLSTSYREAMTALNLPPAASAGRVNCYRPGMEDQLHQSSALDFERFEDAVSQRHYKEAKKPFEIFFAQCGAVQDTPSGLRSVLLPLSSLLEEAAAREKVDPADLAEDFFCYASPKSLKRNVLELLDRMADSCLEIPSDKGYTIAKKAELIITRDYTDSLLGLYKISEELGVSNSYLSTTFKQTYGIGIIQYINQLRINLAKDLILGTSMSIKEIATAVGFSSDISFIRVFKKYEAKTPNTLRKES